MEKIRDDGTYRYFRFIAVCQAFEGDNCQRCESERMYGLKFRLKAHCRGEYLLDRNDLELIDCNDLEYEIISRKINPAGSNKLEYEIKCKWK